MEIRQRNTGGTRQNSQWPSWDNLNNNEKKKQLVMDYNPKYKKYISTGPWVV